MTKNAKAEDSKLAIINCVSLSKLQFFIHSVSNFPQRTSAYRTQFKSITGILTRRL
jgi:hypothetical protein